MSQNCQFFFSDGREIIDRKQDKNVYEDSDPVRKPEAVFITSLQVSLTPWRQSSLSLDEKSPSKENVPFLNDRPYLGYHNLSFFLRWK